MLIGHTSECRTGPIRVLHGGRTRGLKKEKAEGSNDLLLREAMISSACFRRRCARSITAGTNMSRLVPRTTMAVPNPSRLLPEQFCIRAHKYRERKCDRDDTSGDVVEMLHSLTGTNHSVSTEFLVLEMYHTLRQYRASHT
eukprot:1215318-Rhodomonas_salina.1